MKDGSGDHTLGSSSSVRSPHREHEKGAATEVAAPFFQVVPA